MKHSNIFKYVAGVAVLGFMTSCNDFLDQEPMSSVSPEKYLKDESQLEVNPAKRKATPIKNEKRFSEQKRKAMKIIKAILEIVSPLLLH